MAIQIVCSACRTKHDMPDSTAGKKGKCRACGAVIAIPGVVTKQCITCGIDVSRSKRTKDGAGQYYCQACWKARFEDIASEMLTVAPSVAASAISTAVRCSRCGNDFPYDQVTEFGGIITCRTCTQRAKRGNVGKDEPPSSLAGSGGNAIAAPKASLTCPECGGMFAVDRMDVSGLCKKCAGAYGDAKPAPAVRKSRRVVLGGIGATLVISLLAVGWITRANLHIFGPSKTSISGKAVVTFGRGDQVLRGLKVRLLRAEIDQQALTSWYSGFIKAANENSLSDAKFAAERSSNTEFSRLMAGEYDASSKLYSNFAAQLTKMQGLSKAPVAMSLRLANDYFDIARCKHGAQYGTEASNVEYFQQELVEDEWWNTVITGAAYAETITDGDGRYAFNNIPTGKYVVAARYGSDLSGIAWVIETEGGSAVDLYNQVGTVFKKRLR